MMFFALDNIFGVVSHVFLVNFESMASDRELLNIEQTDSVIILMYSSKRFDGS
ncbi:hypothetical protein Hanom_Chr03g00229041 [Helianthus anomalus]